jgi:adenosylhomocysteine nucleosidase
LIQVGVVAALNAEARTLGAALPRRDGLASLQDGALLAVSGMGGALAAAAARRLIDAGAAALMSFGLAGGLDPALDAGCVVLPEEVLSRSGARHTVSLDWYGRIRGAVAAQRPIASGALLSDIEPLVSAADKAAAFRDSGAVAADMESFAVAEAARNAHIPFVVVRVICDTARDTLPRAVIAASRGGAVSLARLTYGLATAPWELLALLRLARRYRTAMRSLELAAKVRTA